VLMISAQEPQVKFPFHTFAIPPDMAWLKCAENPKMASYIIKLTSQNEDLDPTFYGGDFYKLKLTSQEKYGFYAMVANDTASIVISKCGTLNNGELTNLSTGCAREFLIPYPGQWCLLIANPTKVAQAVNVLISFTQSVFVEGTYRTDSSVNSDLTLGTSSLTGVFDNNNKRRNIKA
ncbi:16644_t:CDS:2, partial [Funneliformis mosseae]